MAFLRFFKSASTPDLASLREAAEKERIAANRLIQQSLRSKERYKDFVEGMVLLQQAVEKKSPQAFADFKNLLNKMGLESFTAGLTPSQVSKIVISERVFMVATQQIIDQKKSERALNEP